MYAETTSEGINLIGLDRPAALAIRDSLQRTAQSVALNDEERRRFAQLIIMLNRECENQRMGIK